MAEEKKTRKKKAPEAPQIIEKPGDVRIVIGPKGDVSPIQGVETWVLSGEDVTKKGDRSSVAYVTTQELYDLGWIKKRF